MNRLFSKKQRIALAMASNWKCSICGISLPKHWHSDHKIPFSKGGKTDVINGQALCPTCNLKKGNKMNKIVLRDWQQRALEQATNEFCNGKKLFLTHATPGGGKTIHGLSVFEELRSRMNVSHVVILAPSTILVNQWQLEAKTAYGIELSDKMIYSGQDSFSEFRGVVMTYQAMNERSDDLRIFCSNYNVLVIADEMHHVSEGQSWGDSFRSAFDNDKAKILATTGTPWTTQGKRICFLNYDSKDMAIPDFSYDKETAIKDLVCRVTQYSCNTAKGLVFMDNNTNTVVAEYGTLRDATDDNFDGAYKKTLQSVKHFKAMFFPADEELSRLRVNGAPMAGGLIVAPDIKTAHAFQDELASLTGEEYPIVHSKMQKPHDKINAFRNSNDRWLISVEMITEGVDIKRLQVCIFLSLKSTELFFRQVVGRIERIQHKKRIIDHTAYFYYTDVASLNDIVEVLEDENKAGVALKEQSEVEPKEGNGTKRVDDEISLEEVSTEQSGMSVSGFNYDIDVVRMAMLRRRNYPDILGDMPLFYICKVIMAENSASMEAQAVSYAETQNDEYMAKYDVPLTVKKDRLRARMSKEINRKLFAHFNGDVPIGIHQKVNSKINRISGMRRLDDSASLETLERRLAVVTNGSVAIWLI